MEFLWLEVDSLKKGRKSIFLYVLFLWIFLPFHVFAAENTDSPAYVEGEIIITYDSSVSEGVMALEEEGNVIELGGNISVVELESGQSVEDALTEYRNLPGVLSVQPNYYYDLIEDHTAINDPGRDQQWYLQSIHINGGWNISKTEGQVKVAVIDSGIDMSHPDLVNNINKSLSWDFINNAPLRDDPAGHGTHVAGIISAQANNGLGIAGVSYNAEILGYNVFNGDKAKTSDIQLAIYKAVDDGARVINMSLGGYGPQYESDDYILRTAIQSAVENNVVVVCAGGNGIKNRPQTQPCYPADYEECISVTAVKNDNKWAGYDYNHYKDITAPGYGIYSTIPNNYGYKNGTSMAAPMVSGVAAMMLAKDPSLTVDEVKNILYSTATDIGTEGKDNYFGYGLVNAEKALKVVNGQNPDETEIESKEPESESQEPETQPVLKDIRVKYKTHVQTYGWQDWKADGDTGGTSGESKRLEGIEILLDGTEGLDIGIHYKTHVQTYGWQDWVSNGTMSGTSGQGKRLEAIQIQLTGSDADKYDIYYRVHAQTYGWLDWTKNGQPAGTAGYAKRLEAIQIVVKKKGEAAPGNAGRAYIEKPGDLVYRTHIQTIGWQNWTSEGGISGTTGLAKRLEGIEITLNNKNLTGSIQYKTHVQTYGWQDWVSDGAMSGTAGQSKRLEAIRIRLTGELDNNFDIYYRVHAQTYGWLGWAKNGEAAGTEGLYKRLEAIEIQILPKGSSSPGTRSTPFIKE